MSRGRFVWHGGRWMPRGEWEALRLRQAGVAIHSDFAEPVHCQADGKMHTSRTSYAAVLREHGLVEVGRTEARRMAERGQRPAHVMPPVRETLRRFLNG